MSVFKFFAAIILSATFILGSFTAPAQAAEKKIFINTASRLMMFFDGNVKVAVYHLGLGKPETPTPSGYYKILEKVINPSWISPSDPEYEIPSGSDNPLGYRWMQIQGNYGIHGTNRPDSIGHYVSNGCIRMNEKDVEELYEQVEVGTPVEITYNRVVVEKTAEDDVVYYIYPDGYGIQNLTVADVAKWIEPFGVLPFESDYNISQKIEASDGEPTYIGKPYNIEVNGKLIQPTENRGTTFIAKAVVREGITYLPVVPITKALQTKLAWNQKASTLESSFGKVVCQNFKDQLYCNADDASILFNIEGGLQINQDGTKIFRYKSLGMTDKPDKPTTPPIDKPTTPPVDKPTTPPIDKPTTPPIDKPTTPPVDKPTTPPVDKPTTPPVDKPTTPPTNKPDKPTVDKPDTPPTDKPNTPTVDKPDKPTVDKPDTPTVDKPDTPTVDKPDTPTIDKPDTTNQKIYEAGRA